MCMCACVCARVHNSLSATVSMSNAKYLLVDSPRILPAFDCKIRIFFAQKQTLNLQRARTENEALPQVGRGDPATAG